MERTTRIGELNSDEIGRLNGSEGEDSNLLGLRDMVIALHGLYSRPLIWPWKRSSPAVSSSETRHSAPAISGVADIPR
jgi:hypothetical protein